ncbi:TetR/AcrR family transcriptional regulator [Lysinibacillus sp. SGAir0095]|uniref:TetR/AcrR family transcriptional regulator n=1 Tax=Lysinibacillus sp. SGAir0095 TaxID=2070463 RepID=UPI0010CD1443|nr:TetR/AcrR family transcriptional regulator [Lysinibacillus sp. SGAir0095]QCR30848.1 dihydroxyacetone kinase transcriptional activator DhaS [Lysinibacillus sp. SGAir0095]
MKHSDETKQILAISLKELMKNKPLEKISIRELTENANVNRQTFYYHFEDIYDLLKWTFQQETIQLLDVHENSLLWKEGLLELFKYLEANKDFCLCALQSLGRGHLKRFFYSDISTILGRVIKSLCEKLNSGEEHIAFLTHFYTLSLAGLVESWLLGEMDHTPEEIIEIIDMFIQDQIRGAEHRINGIG